MTDVALWIGLTVLSCIFLEKIPWLFCESGVDNKDNNSTACPKHEKYHHTHDTV